MKIEIAHEGTASKICLSALSVGVVAAHGTGGVMLKTDEGALLLHDDDSVNWIPPDEYDEEFWKCKPIGLVKKIVFHV